MAEGGYAAASTFYEQGNRLVREMIGQQANNIVNNRNANANNGNNNNNGGGGGFLETLTKVGVAAAVTGALAYTMRFTSSSNSGNNNQNQNQQQQQQQRNNNNNGNNNNQPQRNNNNNNQNQNQNNGARNNNNNNNNNRNPGSPNNNNNNQQQRNNNNGQAGNNNNNNNNNTRQQVVVPPPNQARPRRVGNSPWMNIAVLGQGANGIVYKGIHIETGQIVAIKEMLNASGDRELRREMEILRHLSHPNLVGIHAFEVVAQSHVAMRGQGACRLVMDLCGNGTLIDLLKQTGAVPEPRLREYARQLLSGLQVLHEHQPHPIVHRDLKPANVLVDEVGILRIADFGLSRYANTMRDITRLAGTPLYLSPEAVRGHFSMGSDVWALACTLIQLATNKLPWDGQCPMDNNASLMFYLSDVPTDPVKKANHHPRIPDTLSDECKDFFKSCFHHDYTQRGTCRTLMRHKWISNGQEDDEEDDENNNNNDEEHNNNNNNNAAQNGVDNNNNNNNGDQGAAAHSHPGSDIEGRRERQNRRRQQRLLQQNNNNSGTSGAGTTTSSGEKTTTVDSDGNELDYRHQHELEDDEDDSLDDEDSSIYESSDFQSTESSLPAPPPLTRETTKN